MGINKPKAPCYVAGKMCEKHTAECKVTCDRWKEYEKAIAAYRDNRISERNKEYDFNSGKQYAIDRSKSGHVRTPKKSRR